MAWFGISKGRGTDGQRLRRAERYQTLGLSCPLGAVLDLSSAGMQVCCTGRPPAARGDVRQFTISSGAQRLEVSGRVVWVRRTGWKAFQVGVHFLHSKPGLDGALVQLAKYGFVGRKPDEPASPETPRVAMEVEDLYQILAVQPEATPEEVHAAYRAMARTVHPDVSKDPQAGAQFVLISKAYSVLRDPDKRRKYDRLLASCA